MAGQFQGREPTWKPFYVPYHLPIHGTAWLWAIFDHPSHISMAGGGQKWLIFRSKSGRNGRLVPGQGTNLETVLCAISPPNTWDSMTMDHFCKRHQTEDDAGKPIVNPLWHSVEQAGYIQSTKGTESCHLEWPANPESKHIGPTTDGDACCNTR